MNLNATGIREIYFSSKGVWGGADPNGIYFFIWDETFGFNCCCKAWNKFICWTELARNLERLSIWRNKNGSQGFYLEKFECELGHTDGWVGCRIKYSPDSGPDSIFACPYSLTHPHKSSANNKTVTMLKSLVETWEVNNVVPALFSPSGYLGEQHSFF